MALPSSKITKFLIFQEMKLRSFDLKRILLFTEMELSSFIFFLYFRRQLSELEKKNPVWKNFLYFGNWNFLAPSLTRKVLGEGINVTLPLVFFTKMYLLERRWSPAFLWLLILSWVTSFLKNSLKFPKSFRR